MSRTTDGKSFRLTYKWPTICPTRRLHGEVANDCNVIDKFDLLTVWGQLKVLNQLLNDLILSNLLVESLAQISMHHHCTETSLCVFWAFELASSKQGWNPRIGHPVRAPAEAEASPKFSSDHCKCLIRLQVVKSAKQKCHEECPMRVPCKSVKQKCHEECTMRVPCKSVTKELSSKHVRKSALQECHKRVSIKSVMRSALQECHRRAPSKSVMKSAP